MVARCCCSGTGTRSAQLRAALPLRAPTPRDSSLLSSLRQGACIRSICLLLYRRTLFLHAHLAWPSEPSELTFYLLPCYTTLVCAQDYCIECPATGSLFSIKDGSIQSWYPNNPVLRALTPKDTCRNMEVRSTLQREGRACMSHATDCTACTT